MHIISRILSILLTLGALLALPGCHDDNGADEPSAPDPAIPPDSVITELAPNTTIYRLKELYWRDNVDYTDSVASYRAARHVVIGARVVSSDETRNINNFIVVQDSTASIAIAVDGDRLFQRYPVGQELIIDVTGMKIGRSTSLMMLTPQNRSAEFFESRVRLSGRPDVSLIDTLLIRIPDLNSTAENMRRMQNRLVRFNDVYFNEGGQATFSASPANATDRNLRDKPGNGLSLLTSGNASFANDTLPAGQFDIVGILTSGIGDASAVSWKIILRSTNDILNIRPPMSDTIATAPDSIPPGTGSAQEPFSVARAIFLSKGEGAKEVYVNGFIVGSVNGQDPKTDARFSADYPSALNILIADTPATNDISACVIVQLPYGALRSALNLAGNSGNFGREIVLFGDIGTYLGMPAICSTSAYSFK